jgi:hypothetical protein
VWKMILESVAESQKHKVCWYLFIDCIWKSNHSLTNNPPLQDCLRMLANVLIQRIMCRTKHSKDVMTHVHSLANEIFGEDSPTIHHSASPAHTLA